MKKFLAGSMPEAMKKVKSELGNDAVILNSKVIYTGGFLGLFKTKQIEVVAGIDSSDTVPVQKMQDRMRELNHNETASTHLEEEIKELKAMVSVMSKHRSTITDHFPPVIQEELSRFRLQDFDESWLMELGSYLHEKWKLRPEDHEISNWSKEFLQDQLKSLSHQGIIADKKYINILGPTGVGKTTTIAKIAAKLVVDKKKKVAFITTDTYRIAAIEQLKTYAQLLNVPLEVVYNRKDFDQAVAKFADYDHVFIDTAGRNYREQQYVDDLQKVVDFSVNMQSFLVLSMTAKQQDMQAIVDRFKKISIQQLIFTKWDESASVGPAFHIMVRNQKGAAYLTTGQAVPEDIVEASDETLYEHLVESVNS